MKMTIAIIMIACMQVSAGSYAQKITLSQEKASLEHVLKEVKKQTGYLFFYNQDWLKEANAVDIEVRKASIEEVLAICFKGQPLTYSIVDKTIILSKRELVPNRKELIVEKAPLAIITGTVKDSKGVSLPGVSVKIKGSTTGTTTDLNGNFSINVPENTILVFSYIGFLSQETATNGRTVIEISLVEDAQSLGEVVVTALGVTKTKRALSYSSAEVKGDEFTQARENNIASALTGKIAGVDATQVASGPGGSSRVIIRGAGAINSGVNNQPLYVVNGLPISNDNRSATTTGGGFNFDRGDGISSFNPDDIETITVLKSGAAAALYGSQAANGVILITTKQGKAQKGIGVEVNSNMTYGTPTEYPNYQYEYGSGNDGTKPTTALQAYNSNRLSFGAKMDGTPVMQFDGVMRPYFPVRIKDNVNDFYRPSRDFTNTLALYGGSDQLTFRLSLSNLNSQAQTPNSSFDRKIANLSAMSHLGKNNFITVEGNAQYNIERGRNRPSVAWAEVNPGWATYMLANTVSVKTLAPGYDANGDEIIWNSVLLAPNPYYVINKMVNGDLRNRFIGSGSIKVNILKNLFIKGSAARDFQFQQREQYVPKGNAYTPKGYYDSFSGQQDRTNLLGTINYSSTFLKDFNVFAMGGVNQERNNTIDNSVGGRDFILADYISYQNLAVLNLASKGEGHSGINSLFGSADFDYKKVVYLSLTGRKDWFSTLNIGHNAIFYPSIGGNVILSDIIKMPRLISYFKIRGSWAQVGNATISPYSIKRSFGLTTGGFNGTPVQGAPNSLLNPDIQPLTVTTTEGGFEVQLLNNQLGFDVTYYDRVTTNNIIAPPISIGTGYASGNLNVGTLTNKGIELLVTGTPVKTSDFSWDASYNFAWNKSKIVSLAPGITTTGIGNSVQGSVTVVNQLGLPYATLQGNVFLKDANGVQVYNKASGFEANVLSTNLGTANPPYTMGFTNTFRYKRLSMNILLDGKFGAVAYNNIWHYAVRFGLAEETLRGRETGIQLNGVDQTGAPFSKLWPVNQQQQYYNNYGTNYSGSLQVFNTDFIKLRSFILNYNVPAHLLKFAKIQSASIALVARNLAILYRDKRVKEIGLDPEMGQTTGNAGGTSGAGEPRTRNIGMSLNLKF